MVSGPDGQGQAQTGSGTVKIDGKAVCRVGDADNVGGIHHFNKGSGTVKIEGKAVVRVSDTDDHDNRVQVGSPTVKIDG